MPVSAKWVASLAAPVAFTPTVTWPAKLAKSVAELAAAVQPAQLELANKLVRSYKKSVHADWFFI
jgi:hypothetical protein